jgi:signal transduction histidine kinase
VPLDTAFGRWGEVLRGGGSLFGDVEDFPEAERPLLEAQGIQSLIVQPIFNGPHWWGFIGFDACDQVKSWERLEVDTLHIASLLLGAVIHRQEREERLRHTQKLEVLGRMASSVAHDLNNFLGVIASTKQLLEDELWQTGARTAATDSLCEMLGQAVKRADALTGRLLTFSKRQPSVTAVACPLRLVREEEPLLRQALRNKAQLTIGDDSQRRPVWPVLIDAAQLSQVLLNLVVNARDAMPSGGEVRVLVSTVDAAESPAAEDAIPPGRWSLIRVADTGCGMPPEVLESAFEPFFTTKEREHGTGLGLSTVRTVVDDARGHVRVSSTVGAGTEFRIYLPAVEQPATTS